MKEEQITDDKDISSNENAEDIYGKKISSTNNPADPATWIINDELRDLITLNGFDQNINADFSNSKRIYNDCTRYFSASFFHRTLLNGEKTRRPWLLYSLSKGRVYCAPCLLFDCSTQFKGRAKIQGRIDTDITLLHEQEISYWRNVLKQVLAAVKYLTSRGLPFRGDDERFGSQHNGNYMMLLELIAQFDTFLAEHINRFGNKGSGSTSYLSKTICDEFIKLRGGKVQDKIIEEIKMAKCYSMIVDSSPDISHVDQLSFIIRYVKEDGVPVERFLQFVQNPEHKSENLVNAIFPRMNHSAST
ncbi:zinc finger MYM-type protein 1-like [Belonocnema kinseyi]|uniref:zinc finger MYM-type protein 1-like n=1 Tax=Belonocnema kinseyi TaxID=2817044 RepID=UPI00143D9839|nr:zinc finger MYM-type protein 1-like [Belonocnema kinseyi]